MVQDLWLRVLCCLESLSGEMVRGWGAGLLFGISRSLV